MLSEVCLLLEFKMAGRPPIEVDMEQVKHLLALDFQLDEIATIMEISRSTLFRRMKDSGIEKYSDISDTDLDSTIRRIKLDHPNDGEIVMQAHLLRVGIHVQCQRLRLSVHRVDPTNTLRRATTVRRRVYHVDGPNCVWHIDGNHKLIRWRFVIHGGVDGYSRMIVYLQCSTNNTAATVLGNFIDAVQQYGLPDKVRTDLGGENVDVWQLMSNAHQSSSAVITGSSTHNERIERLWNDVRRSVSEEFRCLFYQLEREGSLNPLNETDMYCLQYIFVPRINKVLSEFLVAWNNHKLSTENNKTPNQLFLRGLLSSTPRNIPGPMLLPTPEASQLGGTTSTTTSSPTCQTSSPLPSVSGHINVPRSSFKPCGILEQALQTQIHPLGESRNYGKDIYLNALLVVCNHLQSHPNCGCMLN